MSALLIVLMLSAADGGVIGLDPNDPLYSTCPEGPPTVEVTQEKVDAVPVLAPYLSWLLLHPDRAARAACLLETCDATR